VIITHPEIPEPVVCAEAITSHHISAPPPPPTHDDLPDAPRAGSSSELCQLSRSQQRLSTQTISTNPKSSKRKQKGQIKNQVKELKKKNVHKLMHSGKITTRRSNEKPRQARRISFSAWAEADEFMEVIFYFSSSCSSKIIQVKEDGEDGEQ
jgi:hypothetical protein